MANDKDQDPSKAVTNNDKKDAKTAAQNRVAEIKRKKAEAKKAEEASGGSDDADGDQKADDGKSAAQARVAEIKRKKAEAKKAVSSEEGEAAAADDAKSEKEKKIAAMKAKAQKKKAAASSEEKQGEQPDKAKSKSASAIARAKAAKAKKTKAKPEVEQKPSPNQPLLDKYLKAITNNIGREVLEDSYINRMAKHVPTLIAQPQSYYHLAEFLRYNEQLAFDYLSQIHGVDYETHMEVYVHLYSFQNRQPVALKVKIDRDHPQVDSLAPIWEGANWPEREAYDLLGITFTGHPNLTRIMMPDNWVGHPLRKDYEPYDVEV